MSVRRYDVVSGSEGLALDGKWVRHDDHVAEVERLTADVKRWAGLYQHLADATELLRADLAAARAERDGLTGVYAAANSYLTAVGPDKPEAYSRLCDAVDRAALASLPKEDEA